MASTLSKPMRIAEGHKAPAKAEGSESDKSRAQVVLDSIGLSLNRLDAILNDLEIRLSPVSDTAGGYLDASDEAKVSAIPPPLIKELESYHQRISEQTERVSLIIRRLVI